MYKIDIGKIITENTGKKPPRFVSWLIAKIIHQKELNKFLATDGDNKVGVDFANAVLENFLQIKVEFIGKHDVPENGKFCFVSNHPLGGIDGLVLLRTIGTMYAGNVQVFLNSFLASLPGLAPFAIPVNVAGAPSKDIVDTVNKAFTSNSQIIMFPAQLCSRKQNGIVKDLPWKKGFVQKSIEFDRAIIPIYFHGYNSRSFYNFAKFAEFLSKVFKKPALKKLPMLFLPHEMLKNRGKKFTIVFGNPIEPNFLRARMQVNDENHRDLASYVQERVYALQKKVPGSKNIYGGSTDNKPQIFLRLLLYK